jgi:hypothetical protein
MLPRSKDFVKNERKIYFKAKNRNRHELFLAVPLP